MHVLLTERVQISHQTLAEFSEQALATDPIQSVGGLLHSEVFRADSMSDYQDHFALQLKDWIDEMFRWFRNQDEERYTREGQDFAAKLLTHKVIVKEILTELKQNANSSLTDAKGLQIFHDVLRDPFRDNASQQTFF